MVIEDERPARRAMTGGERRDRGDRGEGPKPNYPFRSNGNAAASTARNNLTDNRQQGTMRASFPLCI